MQDAEDLSFDPTTFSGRVRLFPLPNLVLFPHVMQPLHIFEPRYRAMMEEAITDDQQIALAMLAPGWEQKYEGRPPLRPMACLGRIATYQRLPDNRFNLLLLGQRRVRLLRELPATKLFREAEVEVCEDVYTVASAPLRASLQRQLVGAFQAVLPTAEEVREQFGELLGSDVPLGVLTDIISYTLELPLAIKETLLHECDVDRRASLLVEQLGQPTTSFCHPTRGKFPPDFSDN